MADWAKEHLTPGQTFNRATVVNWFSNKYPKIKRNTVNMHIDGMSVNNLNRRHHASVKPGSGHDLFFKLGSDAFRLWDRTTDPAPLYKDDIEKMAVTGSLNGAAEIDREDEAVESASEFAFERDLRNYLEKNLSLIEPGLKLYDEEGITGVEFPVGGRYIDLLAVDKSGSFVVIELKVSRGYDRVVGQLLRYMGWVEKNMDTSKPVRGIIVANEITDDLKLASSRLVGVRLIEYELAFRLRAVES
jgi:hypothetical protein